MLLFCLTPPCTPYSFFFFYCYGDLRDLHSFPTRRSSDLNAATSKALDTGLVNSASIMVPCPWLPEIADYAKSHPAVDLDRKSTRLNSSHLGISYAVFCLKKKNTHHNTSHLPISHVPQTSC